MLRVENICKSFPTWAGGRLVVLNGLSLTVQRGEILGVIGGNGTGKTTLLKVIAGHEMPDSGTIELDGRNITPMSRLERSRFVRLVTQNPLDNLFPHLTLAENTLLADQHPRGRLLGIALRKRRIESYRAFFERLFPPLVPKIEEPVSLLSGGEIQLSALAVALTANPKILLLDEFVSALSKENRERAFRALTLADCVGGEGTRITIIASHGRSIFDRLGVALLSLDERISQEDKRGLKADQ